MAKQAIKITHADYQDLADSNGGICLECQNQQSGCEPDARNYECEECGAEQVFGVEELLLQDLIIFTDDESNDEC